MIIFVVVLLLISMWTGIYCLKKLSDLPDKQLTADKNSSKFWNYSCIGTILDFILFWTVNACCTRGGKVIHGTGVEIVMFVLTLVFWGIPWMVNVARTNFRMREYYNTVGYEKDWLIKNGTYWFQQVFAVVFKAMLILVVTMCVVEQLK